MSEKIRVVEIYPSEPWAIEPPVPSGDCVKELAEILGLPLRVFKGSNLVDSSLIYLKQLEKQDAERRERLYKAFMARYEELLVFALTWQEVYLFPLGKRGYVRRPFA